jgi:hypothetical protein
MKGVYIFCDESLKRGKLYSNFYGGLLINIKDYILVKNALLSSISINELDIGKEELIQIKKLIVYLPKPSTMYVELRYTKSFSPRKVQYFFEYTK